MKSEFADLVYPLFYHVLETRSRLRSGQSLDFEAEQITVRKLINDAQSTASPELLPDFEHAKRALIYWSDEVLNACDRKWGCRLEWEFYQEDDRATKFYSEYEQVAGTNAVDVIETFYLAAVLGFKGTILEAYRRIGKPFPRDTSEDAARRNWASKAAQIIPERRRSSEPVAPSFETRVEPLKGRRRLSLALGWCLGLALLAVVLGYVLWLNS